MRDRDFGNHPFRGANEAHRLLDFSGCRSSASDARMPHLPRAARQTRHGEVIIQIDGFNYLMREHTAFCPKTQAARRVRPAGDPTPGGPPK
jgi:hypothetical protein